MSIEEKRKAFRYHLRKIARSTDEDEVNVNNMWAMTCADNMKSDVSAKEYLDMAATVKAFTWKAKRKLLS